MDVSSRRDDGGFKLYHYHTSIAAAAVFVLLLTATTLYHGWHIARTRCRIAISLVVDGPRKKRL